MEEQRLPEIRSLLRLIDDLRGGAGQSTQPAIAVIGAAFAAQTGITPTEGFLELVRIVNYLPSLAADLPRGGISRVGINVADRVGRLLDPDMLALESRVYVARQLPNFEFIEAGIHIFDDMTFDAEVFASKQADIYAYLEEMKARVGTLESLSDASKSVVLGQIELMRKSVHRFQSSGVGPFRESIFSVYGRIVIQLEADRHASADDKRVIIDDVLRVFGLAQAAGGLLKIGGPVIAGLLTGPAS